jgi:hypothetical protein
MVKLKKKENMVFLFILVIIPLIVYFTSPANRMVCAHTFSDDDTALLLGVMEEYKEEIHLIKNNINSNLTLSKLHADNIVDQAYITRMANLFYPEEYHATGALTKSFTKMNGLLNSSNDGARLNSTMFAKAVGNEISNMDSLLDDCKNLFLADHLVRNNTIIALTINHLLDSSLRYYETGLKMDTNGNVLSIKNIVDYQNSQGLANSSNGLLNQIDMSQFQNNQSKSLSFMVLKDNLANYGKLIDNKENYNKIMVLLHVDIKSNLQKLFNLK